MTPKASTAARDAQARTDGLYVENYGLARPSARGWILQDGRVVPDAAVQAAFDAWDRRLDALDVQLGVPLLRASDGVDAGTYAVSEPLTVEWVRDQIVVSRECGNGVIRNGDKLDLYRDVLRTVAADRGPLGDLARTALEAEKE